MHDVPSRRTILTGAAGLALAGAASAPALGASKLASGVTPATHALYRRALVIDGNLVAPLDPSAPLDAETAALVRSSGLSAFKMTLGGSGNQSKAETLEELDAMDKAVGLNPGLFFRVTKPSDFTAAKMDRGGPIGIIYSFEAGEMLEGDLANIDLFRRRGVLVMGLSYNRTSPFGSGVMSQPHSGLTELGRAAIARMDKLGVTLDISHSDEATGLDAISASRQPMLITHAGCDAVQANPRNKPDRLIRSLADRGGVFGVFDLSYIAPQGVQPTLDIYMRHLTHALKVAGEDHVGIGSDTILTPFDTSPESLAAWKQETDRRQATGVAAPGEGPPPYVIGLNRPDRCEVIADALLKTGVRARVIDKLLGRNFARVFAETWRPVRAAS